MSKIVLILVAIAVASLTGGCNTMAGLGKDVEKLGDKIEHKAEEKKKY